MLNLALRLIYVVVVARALGAEQYGLYAYALNFSVVFIALAGLGTNPILTRDIGRNHDTAREMIGIGAALRLATSLAALALMAAWAMTTGESGPVLTMILIFGIGLVFRSIAVLFQGVLIGLEQSATAFRVEAGCRVLEVVSVVGLVAVGAPLWTLPMAYAASWALQAAISLPAMPAWRRPRWATDRGHGWQLASQGMPVALVVTMWTWLAQSPLLLGKGLFADPALVGQIALAVQLIAVGLQVPIAILAAGMPLMARSRDRGDGRENQLKALIMAAAWLAAVAAWLLGPDRIGTALAALFGAGFTDAGGLLASAAFLGVALLALNLLNNTAILRRRVWAQAMTYAPPLLLYAVAATRIDLAGPAELLTAATVTAFAIVALAATQLWHDRSERRLIVVILAPVAVLGLAAVM